MKRNVSCKQITYYRVSSSDGTGIVCVRPTELDSPRYTAAPVAMCPLHGPPICHYGIVRFMCVLGSKMNLPCTFCCKQGQVFLVATACCMFS